MRFFKQFIQDNKGNTKYASQYLKTSIFASVCAISAVGFINQDKLFKNNNQYFRINSNLAEASDLIHLQKGTKVYRRQEVQKHRTINDGVWVTYQDGVYDVTYFLKVHPGGAEKLMLAAGGAIEPFWEMYPFHKKESVRQLLNPYKIGNLHPDDILKPNQIVDFKDIQTETIDRSQNLVKIQQFPFCAETNRKFLTDDFITPSNELFVRNHSLTPEFDDDDFEQEFRFQLKFINQNQKITREYSLKELKQLKSINVIATMACAGNRRKHTKKMYDVKGLDWDVGAIGNSQYRGVLIRDLLLDSGFSEEDLQNLKGKHLVATGLDSDFQGKHFQSSIPLERVIDPENKVILAWELNDNKIPKDHGYPLRLVAPGYIGVRNCKWVASLEISDEEADSSMQRRDYKWITETDWQKIDYSKYPSIQGNCQNSCICEPNDGQVFDLKEKKIDKLTLKGWAVGNGEKGTQIVKVQISLDNGQSWSDAQITHKEQNDDNQKVFSWSLWSYELDLNKIQMDNLKSNNQNEKILQPMVRSIDNEGTIQQGEWKDMFNVRGLLNTTPHQIDIKFKI